MTTTVKVVLKTGRRFDGPIWEWRPKDGWFTLVLDPTHYPEPPPERFDLDDVESAVEYGLRVGILRDDEGRAIGPRLEDVDLLLRAKEEGWRPQT